MSAEILIVDDDMMSLMRAEMILNKAGYQIKKATSGEVALEVCRNEKVDLVLLDVEMPGMSGVETLKQLRCMEHGAEVPVIFLTGTIEDELREAGKALKVSNYISKPFLPPNLLEEVENILA